MKQALEVRARRCLPALAIPGLLVLCLLASCRTDAGPDAATGESNGAALTVQFAGRPPSAFVALVRMLEVVDAMRSPNTDIRLRAVEGDVLPGREGQGEHVRILLDMTLFAHDFTEAQVALDELLSALETEGRATRRVDEIAPLRLRRVFEEMRWSGNTLQDETVYDGLVSVSNTLRIEVYAGRRSEVLPTEPGADGDQPATETESVAEYIREAAAAEGVRIGPLGMQAENTRDGASDLKYRIRASDRTSAFTRLQIGSFLQSIEARSPGVRITHVGISPADPGEDVREDLWTFDAEMNIRVRSES